MDIRRVVELYAPGPGGTGQVGSGYRLSEDLVLTAAHVVAGLPTAETGQPVPDTVEGPGVCQARPLRERAWTAALVVWRDQAADLAVLRLGRFAPSLLQSSPAPRWGRV